MKTFTNIFIIVCAALCVMIQCIRRPVFTIKRVYESPYQIRIDALMNSIDKEHSELDDYRSSHSGENSYAQQQQDYQARIDTLQAEKEKLIADGCIPQ